MKLKVPYLKQRKITCGPSSLQQVFAYYGKKLTLDEILKNVKMFKNFGTWTAYLGLCAMELGYKVKLIYYNVKYVDPTWFKLPRKKLIKKLKQSLKKAKRLKDKRALKSLIKYLEGRGKIEFRIPSKQLLINCLNRKIPPIVCLSCTSLRGNKRVNHKTYRDSEYGQPEGHFIVVSGYENGKFIIADPSAKYGGILKVPEDKLIFSWFFWGGDALIIEK